jgi:hypothetical protein
MSWRILLPAASELKMEAAGPSEMLFPVYRIHGITSWKTILFNIHYHGNVRCIAVQVMYK